MACRDTNIDEGYETKQIDRCSTKYHSANVGTVMYSAPEQSSSCYDTSVSYLLRLKATVLVFSKICFFWWRGGFSLQVDNWLKLVKLKSFSFRSISTAQALLRLSFIV